MLVYAHMDWLEIYGYGEPLPSVNLDERDNFNAVLEGCAADISNGPTIIFDTANYTIGLGITCDRSLNYTNRCERQGGEKAMTVDRDRHCVVQTLMR